jgi:hypothetical protein
MSFFKRAHPSPNEKQCKEKKIVNTKTPWGQVRSFLTSITGSNKVENERSNKTENTFY